MGSSLGYPRHGDVVGRVLGKPSSCNIYTFTSVVSSKPTKATEKTNNRRFGQEKRGEMNSILKGKNNRQMVSDVIGGRKLNPTCWREVKGGES